MSLPEPPFVLLDDARADGAPARLYAEPVDVVRADRPEDVPDALAALRRAEAAGLHAAGFLRYEAGAGIEPRAWPNAPAGTGPLLWFGLFRDFRVIAREDVPALLPDPAGAWALPPAPLVSRDAYGAQFDRVKDAIAAGDIYQANLTFAAQVGYAGAPAALYALLRERAKAGYGALVATGDAWLLSLSPELFFALEAGRLTARPMKGTALRGDTPDADARNAEALRADPKQRAENLMIVDLMRNDLSRVARAGSVQVPQLFAVETYPTVHQMVSTVTAELAPERGAVDALAALFPCGSVTGAPKIRAMQIIAGTETAPRGAYTGAIGRIDADGDAMFNVAIRTLSLRDDGEPALRGDGEPSLRDHGEPAVMGLGSGVVADSQAEAEWQESLAKGAFVTAGETGFDLIETMRFDPIDGLVMLERHLARIKASADWLGFAFDRHGVRNELQAATFRLREPRRVRLLLARSGAIAIGIAPIPALPAEPVRVRVVAREVAPHDFRLAHKTSRRSIYDAPRIAAGSYEVVFTDAEGYLTEGSFTSVFVPRDGLLVTPPLARGLLPSVLRADLIERGEAIEGELRPEDLRGGFLIGNALRGLIRAEMVA